MDSDPNAPCRKTVFKVNSGKLPYSENYPMGCAYCGVRRAPGQPPMQLCSGCRGARYCSREHQRAHWPLHKGPCKIDQQAASQQQQSAPALAILNSMRNLPSAEERRYLVQDWKELHRKTLEEAIAWALHDTPKPYDFHKTCMWFFLNYRSESQGNPSLAYELIAGNLSPAPDPATPMATSYTAFLPQIEEAYEEEKGNKHFVNVVPTIYVMDNEVMWMTVTYIYTWNLPKYRPSDRPMCYRALHGAHTGLVWRLVGETDNDWAPGLMTKHPNGKKWVWKKHSIQELDAKGIKIPPPGPYVFP